MARSMESLTTIAMQQRQQQDDDDEDYDDDGRTLDRLASFAAISDTGVATRRRLLQRRHLATGRRLSLPDTATDIRKADSYVETYLLSYNHRPPLVEVCVCLCNYAAIEIDVLKSDVAST